MATTDQLLALLKSHGEGDDDRFYAVAMQVAASAARGGNGRQAQQMRDVIDESRGIEARRRSVSSVAAMARPRGELSDLLSIAYPEVRLSDLSLADEVSAAIVRVVAEHRQREVLRSRGFYPSRRLLFVGPPGTGKTMTACALAGEIGVPLFTLRLDGLITKHLGETASKLRLIFEAMVSTRGVYLFDEVDALAGERSNGNDVGEIRRVLNSFLQFLEQDSSDSILVAATNHPQLLDRAFSRRFDLRIEFPLPSASVAESVLRNRLGSMARRIAWKSVVEAGAGLSHADLTNAAETAAKLAILSERTTVTTADLRAALDARRTSPAV